MVKPGAVVLTTRPPVSARLDGRAGKSFHSGIAGPQLPISYRVGADSSAISGNCEQKGTTQRH